MRTQIKNLEDCKAQLIIEFENGSAMKAYNLVIKDLGKRSRIDGFPPDKVPKSVIENKFGKQAIENETIDKLLQENLGKVLETEKINLLSTPLLEDCNRDFANTLTISLNLEVKPEIKLPEYKNIKVKVPRSELKDTNTEKMVLGLAKEAAEWTDIIENPLAELEDLLIVDFSGVFADGSEIPHSKADDFQVQLLPENFAPLVAEQLVGTPIDEVKEIKSSFPADYEDKELAGKDAIFTVKISKIQRKFPLAIDETLAQKFNLETVEDLYKKAEEQIQLVKRTIEEQRSRAIILENIINNTQINIPDWLVLEKAEKDLEQKHEKHEKHEHNDGSECHHEKKEINPEDLEEKKKELKFTFINAELIKQENIKVDDKEINAEIYKWLQAVGKQGEYLLKNEKFINMLVDNIRQNLLFEKLGKILISFADIEFIEESEENLNKLKDTRKVFPNSFIEA